MGTRNALKLSPTMANALRSVGTDGRMWGNQHTITALLNRGYVCDPHWSYGLGPSRATITETGKATVTKEVE